ncbi:MAG: AraC family transcriptional regulator [Saprospiraceae bacterium]|nr:AraC family transcriptional regulator [Saprospiraceae bacterium]
MQSWLHTPCPPLDQFIEYFFLYENLYTDHLRERLLPDGHIELVIDLRESTNFWCAGAAFDRLQTVRSGWLSGLHRRFITIEAAQGASMLVVRFRPGRIGAFLTMPAAEIAGQVVPLDLLWGSAFRTLRQQLLDSPEPAAKFAHIEAFFLKKWQPEKGFQPVVDFALSRLLESDTGAGIAALVEKTGYSHKHFVALFNKHIGVSPKVFSRILKFQQAVRDLQATREPDWAQLSFSCGYYDQAHFIHEFRSFSGYTPSFYLAKRGDYLNYLPDGDE